MSDEAAAGPLEDRELRNLASATGAAPDLINRIMAAAAEAGIAYLLPQLRATGHYPEYAAFALPGAGKCAHLLIEGEEHGLCGVALPYAAIVDLPRATPLCIGCAWHAKRLTTKSFDARRLSRAFRATESRGPAPVSDNSGSMNLAVFRPRSTTPAKPAVARNPETTPGVPAPPEKPVVDTSLTKKAPARTEPVERPVVTPKTPPAANPPSLFDLAS